jgi:hypothetical protein
MKTTLATVLLLVSAAGCAPRPGAMPAPAAPPAAAAAPAALNPVGRYEFSTSLQGQPLTGTVEITGTAGAYAGRITSSATEPIPITGVTVTGQEMVVTGDTPSGTLTIHMTFTGGPDFTGNWTLPGDGAPLTGRRVS